MLETPERGTQALIVCATSSNFFLVETLLQEGPTMIYRWIWMLLTALCFITKVAASREIILIALSRLRLKS